MAGALRPKESGEEIAARIRAILASRGLSLHAVAIESRRIYGVQSSARVPHTLYSLMAKSGVFRPSFAQTCALSRISGYRLSDWLAVLGVDLATCLRLQIQLPLPKTRLVDADLSPFDQGLNELTTTGPGATAETVLPLGDAVNLFEKDIHAKVAENKRCIWARIGQEDALAFPELLAGSLICVSPNGEYPRSTSTNDRRRRAPLLLIEHDRGLLCGRFHLSSRDLLQATAAELPFPPFTFRHRHEARILGEVNMEFRSMDHSSRPIVSREFSTVMATRSLSSTAHVPGALIRQARRQVGLTLRRASLLSREVAKQMGNDLYRIAQSTLSEYEAQAQPPRHIEKAVSLCLIYGLKLTEMAAASGTFAVNLGTRSLPQELLRRAPDELVPSAQRGYSSIQALLHSIGAPLSKTRLSSDRTSGAGQSALRDCFWLAETQPYLSVYAQGSEFAVVERRRKKPVRTLKCPVWQQPAFVLLLRDGRYLSACCSRDRDWLVLYPESCFVPSERLRIGKDVEIVGQIVALARHLS